ncbi:MAG: hypothetical protein ACOY5V_12345 [Pseudomonadota bacterium]
MTIDELRIDDPRPQRAWVASRRDVPRAVALVLGGAQRIVRAMHRDLAPFELSTLRATAQIERFVLADRGARVQLLVDDIAWLEAGAARLRRLQRFFPHAIQMRIAAEDDPVGDDACLLADARHALLLTPTAHGIGDLWLNHEPRAQTWAASFDRRWEAAAHNLPVAPLGL